MMTDTDPTITESRPEDESKPKGKDSFQWHWLRLLFLLLILLFTIKDGLPDNSRRGRIFAQVQGYEFNYVAWEINALFQKISQAMFGFDAYAAEADERAVVIEYLQLVGEGARLTTEIESLFVDDHAIESGTG